MVTPVRYKILNPKRKYDSFTYSIIELLLTIYYILGTVSGARDIEWNNKKGRTQREETFLWDWREV